MEKNIIFRLVKNTDVLISEITFLLLFDGAENMINMTAFLLSEEKPWSIVLQNSSYCFIMKLIVIYGSQFRMLSSTQVWDLIIKIGTGPQYVHHH